MLLPGKIVNIGSFFLQTSLENLEIRWGNGLGKKLYLRWNLLKKNILLRVYTGIKTVLFLDKDDWDSLIEKLEKLSNFAKL